VKQLEEREVTIRGYFFEYYGMKYQETSIGELQRQLQIKVVEIDILKIKKLILWKPKRRKWKRK